MIDVSASGHYIGDCRALLDRMPEGSVQTCVTSPPYWGLRDYGVPGQLGLEETPEKFVASMVDVFSRVHRALRDDGTLWLNLGDSYAGTGSGPQGIFGEMADRAVAKQRLNNQPLTAAARGPSHNNRNSTLSGGTSAQDAAQAARERGRNAPAGLKPKDLVGIPWMVAFALRAAGWYLRSDIIWHKPNPMPESVRDRPTKSHEYLFLLSKSERYFYDADAIREPLKPKTLTTFGSKRRSKGGGDLVASDNWARDVPERKPRLLADGSFAGANKRTVWTVSTQPYKGAHFATFPPRLITPCVLAGSRPGDIVLDPFFGSGTTGMVAEQNGRRWIGFDLNPEYEELQRARVKVAG